MNTFDRISEIIRKKEKAKLAILKELTHKEMKRFELDDIMQTKYYSKGFRAHPFIEILKEEGLIVEKEGICRITDKLTLLKLLSTKQGDIEKILSMDFGKGDFAGQLHEQEKYILSKVLSFGNSTTLSDLHSSISDDVDHRRGPFAGYSRANYGKKRAKEIATDLVERGFLKINGSLTIPDQILYDFVSKNLDELLSILKSKEDKVRNLSEENIELSSRIDQLKTKIAKLDPSTLLNKIVIHQILRNYVEKAVSRIDQGSYSEAIMNCYRVSETLVNTLFAFLYPDSRKERIKHEDKLKKIWNDEEREKKKYPGIRVIASLLAAVLWYRNKMGAHTEMRPTKEAAKVCLISLVQALIEFDHLGIKFESYPSK